MSQEPFDGTIGETVEAARVSPNDYLINSPKYPSEGNWAFCRFESREIPALRLGFQRGGFNGGFIDRQPSPSYLQLHLELMTREGAILWLPSGMYAAERLNSDPRAMNMQLTHDGRELISLRGWPAIECHFQSADGDLEAQLRFDLHTVTILPDCLLPHCLFAMWESMGDVSGSVRYRDRQTAVRGKVFFDHTRIIARVHSQTPRHRYVYTTMYFADGSGMFGYHSVDLAGTRIEGYCFVVHIDAAGKGRLIRDASLTDLELDDERIAKSWTISYATPEWSLVVKIAVQETGILRCWGSPDAPASRREYSIIPLVLEGSAQLSGAGAAMLGAYGLAEYFNADLWPADKAASPPAL